MVNESWDFAVKIFTNMAANNVRVAVLFWSFLNFWYFPGIKAS